MSLTTRARARRITRLPLPTKRAPDFVQPLDAWNAESGVGGFGQPIDKMAASQFFKRVVPNANYTFTTTLRSKIVLLDDAVCFNVVRGTWSS